jgi:hypothetical protein
LDLVALEIGEPMAGIQELRDFAIMAFAHGRSATEDRLFLALAEHALRRTDAKEMPCGAGVARTGPKVYRVRSRSGGFLSSRPCEGVPAMRRIPWRQTFVTLAAAALFAAPALAQQAGQRERQRDRPPARPETTEPWTVSPDRQHIAGVIVKAESVRNEAGKTSGERTAARPGSSAVRLTINTAAVWRDWYRDQVGQSPSASPKADADRGAKSVATTGEPADRDTDVVVEVDPGARIETLFRNIEGPASPDARTPTEARAAGEGTTSTPARSRDSAVTHFAVDDLKPGLFVEVDFHRESGHNRATTVAVIRPTGGSEGPRAAPAPATRTNRPRD